MKYYKILWALLPAPHDALVHDPFAMMGETLPVSNAPTQGHGRIDCPMRDQRWAAAFMSRAASKSSF